MRRMPRPRSEFPRTLIGNRADPVCRQKVDLEEENKGETRLLFSYPLIHVVANPFPPSQRRRGAQVDHRGPRHLG